MPIPQNAMPNMSQGEVSLSCLHSPNCTALTGTVHQQESFPAELKNNRLIDHLVKVLKLCRYACCGSALRFAMGANQDLSVIRLCSAELAGAPSANVAASVAALTSALQTGAPVATHQSKKIALPVYRMMKDAQVGLFHHSNRALLWPDVTH